MHPGTANDSMETVVGNDNLFMIGVHIAHDCVIGDNIIMGNNVTLGGHVHVEDNVIIGGLSALHQFVRVGKGAIIGGMSGVERDVIPHSTVKGERAHLSGLNIEGLRRANVAKDEIHSLQKAFDIIFSGKNTLVESLKILETTFQQQHFVMDVVNFMKQKSERSFCRPKNGHACPSITK
jgi:UDP-N-acetylglucosamine acyltransferase